MEDSARKGRTRADILPYNEPFVNTYFKKFYKKSTEVPRPLHPLTRKIISQRNRLD